ncbi:MAG: ABC transporter permease subunit [Patescibacteria group bacterium]|nr:ABC transporter permease subunit [Patescibacteria group bacterium]
MNKILTITKKELNSYFNSPLGYIVVSVFLVISGWLFIQTFFIIGQASLRSFFNLLPILFMFIIPAITMSSWAEEKKSGTVEVLMTFPVSSVKVVMAKFFSSFMFLLIMLVLTLVIPVMVSSVGSPDRGVIIAGYIGVIFIGSAYIAIGLWVSSITKNQIISFLVTVSIIFMFYMIGNSLILNTMPSSVAAVGKFLSFSTHFNSILRGVISLSDILYYISVIIFFLFLNVRVIGMKKWK